MFSNIYHVGYLTESNPDAIEYYVTTFGAEVISEAVGSDGITKLAFLKVGNTEVELIEATERVRAANRGTILLDHIGYVVPDITAAAETLREKGISFASERPNVNPRGHQVLYLDASTTHGARMHLTQL